MPGHERDEERLERRVRFAARLIAAGVLLGLFVVLCGAEAMDADYDLDAAKSVLIVAAVLILLGVEGIRLPFLGGK